ncbi:MAG: hypothetical protein ABSH42_07620 [Bryobacteraceae bacterium]|jgi:hypothetical protein
MDRKTSGGYVARALLRAAPALVPARATRGRASVEKSLDAARMSACATSQERAGE